MPLKLTDFPYRLIADPEIRQHIHRAAEVVNHHLLGVVKECTSLGAALNEARRSLSPRAFSAWVYAEFGWSEQAAEEFVQYSTMATKSVCPDVAIELALGMAARSVCLREVQKTLTLLDQYRAIIRGDVLFTRWPKQSRERKPRSRRRLSWKLQAVRKPKNSSKVTSEDQGDCV